MVEVQDELDLPERVADWVRVAEWADINAVLRSPAVVQGWGREAPYGVPWFIQRHLAELDGKEHLERRKMESQLFLPAALALYEEQDVKPLIAEYLERWKQHPQPDGTVEVDVAQEVVKLLLRMAARVSGIDGVDTEEQVAEVQHILALDNFMRTGAMSKLSVEDHEKLVQQAFDTRQIFREKYAAPSLARRRELFARFQAGEIGREELPIDVITIMLQHWDESWDDDLTMSEALMFMGGATGTTKRTVCNSFKRITEWFAEHPEDRALAADEEFLRKVIDETLRIDGVLPYLVRRTTAELTLPSGAVVPADSGLVLLVNDANRDPAVFGEDAASFNPHRELPERVRGYGLAFGAGQHACIGRRAAVGAEGITRGNVMAILDALIAAGGELIPEKPPVPAVSFILEYDHFPIRLAAL